MTTNLERGRTLHSLCYFIEDLSNKKQILKYERRYELPVLGFNEKVAVLSTDTKLLSKVQLPSKPEETQIKPKPISGKQIILKTDNVSGKKYIVVQGKKLEVVQIQKNAEQFEILPVSATNKNNFSVKPAVSENKAKLKIKNSQPPPKFVAINSTIRLKNVSQPSLQLSVNAPKTKLLRNFSISPENSKQTLPTTVRFVKTTGTLKTNKILNITGGTPKTVLKTNKKTVTHMQTSTEDLIHVRDAGVQTDDLETFTYAKKTHFENVSRDELLEETSSTASIPLSDMEMEYLLDKTGPIMGRNVDFGTGPKFASIVEKVIACDENNQDCGQEKPQMDLDPKKKKFIKELQECTEFDVGGNM